MYGQKAWDIVGYTFQAENYCPGCIIDQLPTGPGQISAALVHERFLTTETRERLVKQLDRADNYRYPVRILR